MAIKKKNFSEIKQKFSKKAIYKTDKFFDLGEAFIDATGLPGPAMGHINMMLGHSDTGKTTALVKTAVDAQKKNILPVFLITEQKWDFDHAKLMGLDCEKTETGEWDGFFLFNNDFQYIEQITDYINELIDAQLKGELEYDLLFLWDSVGSVPCQMTFEGKGGKMHNAAALADKVGMGINPFGQPKIKAKGGEALWLNSTLVFLFGNQKNAGIGKITATKDKRKIKFATRSKVSVMKNHVNGLGYDDGKILIVAHGFLKGRDKKDEKESIDTYKEQNSSYWNRIIGSEGGFNISDEETGELY